MRVQPVHQQPNFAPVATTISAVLGVASSLRMRIRMSHIELHSAVWWLSTHTPTC